VDTTDLSFL
jgi:hypothetical protein